MIVDRELPDPLKDKRKRQLGFIFFSISMVVSLSLIFNYEKTESPIIVNTFYQLRRNPKVKDALGENIQYNTIVPWIFGNLNQVKGNIDVTFYVKGSKQQTGKVRLIANRDNKLDEFLIKEWSLTVNNEKIDILNEN